MTMLLPPFHNVNCYNISHIHIDLISRFININMNVRDARVTYIVKRGESTSSKFYHHQINLVEYICYYLCTNLSLPK